MVGGSVVDGFNKTPEIEPKLTPLSGEELQGKTSNNLHKA